MNRLKPVLLERFEPAFERSGERVEFKDNAVPEFLRAIPEEKCYGIIASGERLATTDYPCPWLPDARLVGGIDVIRNPPAVGKPYKRDWYAVLSSPSRPGELFADGPKKEYNDHWLPDVSKRYEGVVVVLL